MAGEKVDVFNSPGERRRRQHNVYANWRRSIEKLDCGDIPVLIEESFAVSTHPGVPDRE